MQVRDTSLMLAAIAWFAGCGGRESTSPAPVESPRQGQSAGAARENPSGSTSSAVAESTHKTTTVEVDTLMKMPSGATFTAAKGWTVTTVNEKWTLQDPSRELSVTLVEVNSADAETAIQGAWRLVDPKFSRRPKNTIHPPARDGWDATTQVVYETATEEARTVFALARRKGRIHYVTLVDGTTAAIDRRSSQLMMTIGSLKVAGVEEESFRGKTARFDSATWTALDAFVEEVRNKTHTVGAAVAIVSGNRIVFEKGYGVRELGKQEPVTPNTLFMIGSVTKPLSTLMMAKLVDEGKFSWNTPVTRLMPSFSLGEAEATEKLTMQHTVCACTGLPRQDMEFLFEFGGVTPEMRMAEMRTMKPTTGFGETFQYSNSMVSAGGYVAARSVDSRATLASAYQSTMQSRVFDPLGMTSTTLDPETAKRREHASPHGETFELTYEPVPLSVEGTVVSVLPAGGAWSNVRDMSRFVMMELAKGRTPEGRTLVSEANLLKRREPQVKMSDKRSYGLGLVVEDNHGVQIVQHNGGTMGFSSDMYFFPEHGVGAVVLSNVAGAGPFVNSIRRRLLEIMFDGRAEASETLEFALKRKRDALAREVAKISFDPDAAWLSKFVGTYANPSLGRLVVRMDGKRAILDAGEWKSVIARKREADGTLKLVLVTPPWVGFEFLPGEREARASLTLTTPQKTYVFDASK